MAAKKQLQPEQATISDIMTYERQKARNAIPAKTFEQEVLDRLEIIEMMLTGDK